MHREPPYLPLPMTRLLHDMETALDRMGSWDLYVDIARAFADSLPETEAAIAGAMEQCAWPEARRLVHSLKSNCAAVGAEELRSRVYLLEKACADGDAATATQLFPALCEELRDLRAELLAL
ncbi:putative Hpt protein [uncultured delta proteobacterium]|uniref:Putative Hpt protein n=1 Tax=uncultured delta proteobacterium TaxID=34034 RepID=A0A212JJI2_9DELT|nr:putative Hpt protein [uncultured delta proteobacterium]